MLAAATLPHLEGVRCRRARQNRALSHGPKCSPVTRGAAEATKSVRQACPAFAPSRPGFGTCAALLARGTGCVSRAALAVSGWGGRMQAPLHYVLPGGAIACCPEMQESRQSGDLGVPSIGLPVASGSSSRPCKSGYKTHCRAGLAR
eukprot:8885431-Alexandrium_andersonii.AAC.1